MRIRWPGTLPERAARAVRVRAERLRSPAAEQVSAGWPGVATAAAGLEHEAEVPVSAAPLDRAELIRVMEPAQRRALPARFGPALRGKRVACLGIPDRCRCMAPALVERLQRVVPPPLHR